MHSRFLIAILAGILALPAAADIIYDCGGAGAFTMVSGSLGVEQIAAFNVGENATATGITWFGGYGESITPLLPWVTPGVLLDNTSPGGNEFLLRIVPNVWDYGDVPELLSNFSPVDIIGGITRTATGYFDHNGILIYRYTATIAPLELHAGTSYGLYIINTEPYPVWGWSTGRAGDSSFLSIYNGGIHYTGGSAGFYLTDDDTIVPEPATLSLLGLGLAGLVLRAARRKRAP